MAKMLISNRIPYQHPAFDTYVNIKNRIQGPNSKTSDTENAQKALLVKNRPPQKKNVFPVYVS